MPIDSKRKSTLHAWMDAQDAQRKTFARPLAELDRWHPHHVKIEVPKPKRR